MKEQEQKYTSNRMVTANVIRGYKNHIEELKGKMEQYDQEISRISNLVKNLEGLVDMDEKHETTIEDVVKFISVSTDHDKDIIRSALGIDNVDETEWAVFYKHVSQITQHNTVPNVNILKRLVEASQGLTQQEVAQRIGFLSTGKIIQLNKILESYGLGRIGLKKERTVATQKRKQCGGKIRETKKKRIEKMVEMTNELNKR